MSRLNCEQLEEFDKEDQIRSLLEDTTAGSRNPPLCNHLLQATAPATMLTTSAKAPAMNVGRRGKASPVDQFSGDHPDLTFNDWLPTLERAAQWNEWTEAELCCNLWGTYGGESVHLISEDVATAIPK